MNERIVMYLETRLEKLKTDFSPSRHRIPEGEGDTPRMPGKKQIYRIPQRVVNCFYYFRREADLLGLAGNPVTQ